MQGAVDAWFYTIQNALNPPSDPSLLQRSGLPDPGNFLRSTFTATLDTLAPVAGQAATLSVFPKDRSKDVPQKLKELLNVSPAYKVQVMTSWSTR